MKKEPSRRCVRVDVVGQTSELHLLILQVNHQVNQSLDATPKRFASGFRSH
jgi:hypothetical protein